jgi:hypothetical protein
VAAEIIRVTATIVSIDKQTPSLTLRTENGDVLAVKVKHPEKLDQIKVGDVMEIFLSQGWDHRGAGVELSRVCSTVSATSSASARSP